MADRRVRIWSARGRFRGIFAPPAVNVIEPLCLQIIRFKIVVGDWPGWGNPAEMPDFPKVFPAQAEEGRAVELRVSPDVIIRVRMERLPVLIAPFFLGLILALDVDRSRIPVGLFATYVIAALQDQDTLAGRGQCVGQRASASAGPDDDYVVVLVRGHKSCLSLGRIQFP